MKLSKLKHQDTERISQRILYILTSVAVVSFGLFYVIGYNIPYLLNPSLNAPLLTDVIIGLMTGLLFLGLAGMVWSVIFGLYRRGKSEQRVNNIPVKKISYIVAGGTAALLATTLLLGSSAPMTVNGKPFTDNLWLKVSDMFIISSLVLLFIAVAAIIFGKTRSYRKPRKQDHVR